MNQRRFFFYFILLGSALATWWLSDRQPTDTLSPTKSGNFPSSYAEGLTVISYNSEGLPRHKLMTPRMTHYDDTETTLLQQPVMWHFSSNQAPWQIQGESAVISEEGVKVHLPGRVTIEREGLGASPPYKIVTRDLTMMTDTSFAETDQAIRIDSHNHWVTAIGMQGWLQEPIRIKLLNQVRGYYENL